MSDAAAKQAGAEAAAWFARLSHVSVTTDTLREFRDWKRDPENAAAYAKVEAAWDAARALQGDPEIEALTATAGHRRRRGVRVGRNGPYLLGGVVLASLAGLAATWSLQSPATYRTGVGEQRLIVLADGSRVRLNTDSAIRVRLRGPERRVELARGEAFFEVKHDPRRPFLVEADGARIYDLGTRFDVRRTASDVRVTLLEGRLEVSTGKTAGRTALQPDQQLVVSSAGLSRPAAVDAAQAASWTSGRLVFHGTPLAQAIAEVNRYSKGKIVLDGPPELAARPVSGVFDTGDSAAFVAAAQGLFALQATPQPDGSTRLTAAGQPPAASPA